MIELKNEDCLIGMKNIKSNSIDVILTDPPYKYLKNQKLEVDFDETVFFNEVKRVLKPDGFIVLFGRGTSFYRWNTMLADLGFNFKEEIIWDKSYSSSPVLPVSRVHETVSIHTQNGILNKVKIPYIEQKKYNFDSLINDIKRISSALKNEKSFKFLVDYINTNARTDYECKRSSNFKASCQTKALGDQAATTMQSIIEGMKEKTIIKVLRDHYKTIHPTQKPTRLLERLLALVIPDKPKDEITILDPFGGSFSTMEAVINMGLNGITFEIDKEYFDLGKNRIDNLQRNLI